MAWTFEMTPLQVFDVAKLGLRLATQYPGLQARPRWSAERMQNYQLRHLRLRLAEARAKVPLYQKRNLPDVREIRGIEDWAALPLLRKDDLLNADVSERLNPDFARADLIESKSSGSTGKALDVYYDRESFYYFILAGLRLYGMAFNYRTWHLQTYIYTSPYPLDSLFGLYPLKFIPTLTPIPELLAQLRAQPPDLLVCYPSHLRAIVDEMTPDDFEKIRPKAVNVNSEMSSASERKFLSEKLNTFVFDDYSSEELTRIASQCPHLTYHIFDDVNYMEVVDDDGRPVSEGVIGHLVGTNLHNRAMPLLRYMQGDRGAIGSKPCACGRRFRTLEKLEGRKNDAFVLPNGKMLSSGFLLDLTYGVFLKFPDAVQAFCLLQTRPDIWDLEVVPGAHWSELLQSQIPTVLSRDLAMPDVQIVLKVVKQVTKTASGKANPIISKIAKN